MSESPAPFVHLHAHSHYSLLTSTIRIQELVARAKTSGMEAIALTDTGNLFGAAEFYFAAKAQGIRPILGAQLLVAPSALTNSLPVDPGGQRFRPAFHLMGVLCENLAGYRSLCALMTAAYFRSYRESQVAKASKAPFLEPWGLVTEELLLKHGEGLFFLAGGMRSEPGYLVLQGREDLAREWIAEKQRSLKDRFFLEISDHGLPEESNANDAVERIGASLGITRVGTVAMHYLDESDAEAQEVLQCIGGNRNLEFDRPKSLVPPGFRFRSTKEMEEHLAPFPGAFEAAGILAARCKVEFRFKDAEGKPVYHLPKFRPDGVGPTDPFDLEEFFRDQSAKGLEARMRLHTFKGDQNLYRDRLKSELEMILRTGFTGYFLVVADFINWAKDRGIPVGPGRGSGAGSLVAYALKITDVDPIPQDLLFERFINPERVSLPDFDIDFCQERRSEVIDYVKKKYGDEMVSQIVTFGKLQAKAVIKDVGRVFGLSFEETNAITSLVPEELNIKLSAAIEESSGIREKMASDPRVAKLMDVARRLEGLNRNLGIHAAGVIITEHPVSEYAPLYVSEDGDVLVQFDKDYAEKVGLVKFDFLGLKTLTVIDLAIRFIREAAEAGTPELDFTLEKIPYDDAEVYRFLSSGDTDGVFQVESSGMKDLCTRLVPENIEDVTAINALFRPGPLGSGMVDDFIEGKHGRKAIRYELPVLEPILRDTYGVILFQEQVMRIARELAGYSLGQADMLRRAMGKKKPEEMAAHRALFIEGAAKRAIPTAKAELIFDLMAKFAEYGFNKSHSAAYGMLTLQTAYLKRYFPVEFMAALMTTEMSNTDKITRYIANARARGIAILPPDVNVSQRRFSVEKAADGKKAIRFGLEAIKGVGGIAVDTILEAREKDGPFQDALGFSTRVSTRKANKKVLEALTLSGAMDSVSGSSRASLFASLEGILERASHDQEEEALGQSSLFEQFSADALRIAAPLSQVLKQEPEWPLAKKLAYEKQLLGFYVSGHPMESWQPIVEEWLGWSTEKVKALDPAALAPKQNQSGGGGYGSRPQRLKARIAGIFTELKEVTTKKGQRMGIAGFEDLYGKVEVVIFPEAFQKSGDALKAAMAATEPMLLDAELDARAEGIQLLALKMEPLEAAHKGRIQRIVVRLTPSQASMELLREIKKEVVENRGNCPVTLEFEQEGARTRMDLPRTLQIAGTPQVIDRLRKLVGPGGVRLA